MDNIINHCYYCGSEAHYQLKNGRWCCGKTAMNCPTNRKLVSKGVKRNYDQKKQGISSENKTIWDGIHCEYGCGNEAKYVLKNGKHCCSSHVSKCPEIKRKNSQGVSNSNQKKIKEGTFICNLTKWRNQPNYQVWNKGLTAKTSESIQKQKNSFKKSFEMGKIIPAWKGKKLPQSMKDHMSESARKRTTPRVSKKRIEYKCLDGSIVIMDSSAEVKVAKILDDHNIKWIRPKFLPWMDDDGKEHHYFADFYLPDFDLYMDPKNDYCFKIQDYKIKKLNQQYSNIELIREYDITFEYIEHLITKRKNG